MRQIRDLLPDQNNLHLFSPAELDSGAEGPVAPARDRTDSLREREQATEAAEAAVADAIEHPERCFRIGTISPWTPRIDVLTSDYPFFGLSASIAERRFQLADGAYVAIVPTSKGLATVYDRDLLIYAVSALVYGRNAGVPISPRVRFRFSDFLNYTGRATGGRSYELAQDALDRLRGTTVRITRASERRRERCGDGWIVSYREVETAGERTLEVLLHAFIYRAVLGGNFLTIPQEYFGLRSPTARRIFELASKNTRGGQSYTIRLARLHEKVGFERDLRKLRFFLQKQMEPLPGMHTSIDLLRDQATFVRAGARPRAAFASTSGD